MPRLADFRRLARSDLWLTLEAVLALSLAAVALRLLPFRWLIRWSGALAGKAPCGHTPAHDARHPGLPGRIGKAVERAARHLPLTLLCLPQALAANWMLRRRGVATSLHFGLALCAPPARRMRAHAWLTADGQAVVGAAGRRAFTEVARFSEERH